MQETGTRTVAGLVDFDPGCRVDLDIAMAATADVVAFLGEAHAGADAGFGPSQEARGGMFVLCRAISQQIRAMEDAYRGLIVAGAAARPDGEAGQ